MSTNNSLSGTVLGELLVILENLAVQDQPLVRVRIFRHLIYRVKVRVKASVRVV